MPGIRVASDYFRPAGDGISAAAGSGEAMESWIAFSAASIANTATAYMNPPGGVDGATQTTPIEWIAPAAGKIEAMYFYSAAAGSGSFTFTYQVNGVDSSLTRTYNLATSADSVDDGVTTVSFAKGDAVRIKVTKVSYTSSPTNLTITSRIRPP